MKKPILAILLCFLVSSTTFGQATFAFFNRVPFYGLDAPVFDAGGNRLSGPDYVAVLYGGPSIDSLTLAQYGTAGMFPVPFTYMPNGQAGYFGLGGAVEIDSVPCGGIAWLQVRAWDDRLGSSYEDVAKLGVGGYGESSFFQKRGGSPCSLSQDEPLLGLQSFSLRAEVPEPSTWLLFLLGLPAILFRKRLFR